MPFPEGARQPERSGEIAFSHKQKFTGAHQKKKQPSVFHIAVLVC